MKALPLVLLILAACDGKTEPKETGLPSDDSAEPTDADGDGVPEGEDCDDDNPAVFPGAVELCNGLDDDCDGTPDDDATDASTWYTDADNDGYGADGEGIQACEPPDGTSANAGDCDDSDPAYNPGATESDCRDPNDYNCDGSVGYADGDGDGYAACEECNDANSGVNPGAEEVCDGIDQNCDGVADEGVTLSFYQDLDNDGWGDGDFTTEACSQPEGYAGDAGDCNDNDPAINPLATEVCDSIDNDCDGLLDDDDPSLDLGSTSTWYADTDNDGYGDPGGASNSCTQPAGTVTDNTDCDDADGDTHPNATETCDSIDNNCDGTTDEASAADAATWYADADNDGYGDLAVSQTACSRPAGYRSNHNDCDDTDGAINPAAIEVCDGVDNECDTLVDDDDDSLDLSSATSWYTDGDGDGFGDPDSVSLTCLAPSGTVTDDTDCDDGNANVNPSAVEAWYDGLDADCAGDNDYDADGDGDASIDYGGTDCDDSDPSRFGGQDCRPQVTCSSPTTTVLAANDPTGVSDIVFDGSCNAYLSTIISGPDYVYRMTSSGSTTVYYGYSNYNISSVALDPTSGAIVVGYSSTQSIGWQSGTSLSVVASSGSTSQLGSSVWSNQYMDDNPTSLAIDSAGCVWTPNWVSNGRLACITSAGAVTSLTLGSAGITSVALDSDDNLYASIGDTIYQVNKSSGALTTWYTASGTVMDFVFDYNDDIYLESTDNVITWVAADLSSSSVFASVSGDARLAIAPDGYLVRLIGNPVSAATYERYTLPD